MKLVYNGGGPDFVKFGEYGFFIGKEVEIPDEIGYAIVKSKPNFDLTVIDVIDRPVVDTDHENSTY